MRQRAARDRTEGLGALPALRPPSGRFMHAVFRTFPSPRRGKASAGAWDPKGSAGRPACLHWETLRAVHLWNFKVTGRHRANKDVGISTQALFLETVKILFKMYEVFMYLLNKPDAIRTICLVCAIGDRVITDTRLEWEGWSKTLFQQV